MVGDQRGFMAGFFMVYICAPGLEVTCLYLLCQKGVSVYLGPTLTENTGHPISAQKSVKEVGIGRNRYLTADASFANCSIDNRYLTADASFADR
jgi:hypothetical protein